MIKILILLLVVFFWHYVIRIPKLLFYSVQDFYKYVKYKKWNECKEFGKIVVYESDSAQSFGCGKSLSAVSDIYSIYRRYNNKPIYLNGKKTIQNVVVMSSIPLNFPHVHFDNFEVALNVLSEAVESNVYILYVDEGGANLNSRSYQKNLNSSMIMKLLTMRHYKFSLYISSQRFSIVDALLRNVTYEVIRCSRVFGRLFKNTVYDGYEYECVGNVPLRCKRRRLFVASNKDFDRYNTNEKIDLFNKENYISDSELLEKITDVTNIDRSSFNEKGMIQRIRKVRGK